MNNRGRQGMFMILVVDDEVLARESIIEKLKELRYTDISQATNGIEAYEFIIHYRPDIVLADIRMPGMDGIELLSKVREALEDTLFIFISGYDLFEYAQKAIGLGAFSYILKPIKDEDFAKVMDKACKRLLQKLEDCECTNRLKRKMNQGLELMRRQFVSELVSGNEMSGMYSGSKFEELEIYFKQNKFCIIIISVDKFTEPGNSMLYKDKEVAIFTIQNKSSEVCSQYNISAYPFDLDNGLGFLINFSQDICNSEILNIYNICCEIKKHISDVIPYAITIGIGTIVDNIEKLNESFKTAQNSVSLKLIKGGNQVFNIINTCNSVENNVTLGFSLEKEIFDCFEKCDMASLVNLFKKLYAPFKSDMFTDTERLSKLNLQLVILLFKTLNQLGATPESTLGDEFILYKQVNSCTGIDSVIEWFEDKFTLCFESIKLLQEGSNRKCFLKAKEFIKKNITNEITLEIVADHVHLSPGYFSRLFKQESGENFVNYITSCKIDKAKLLLKEGIYKVNEVCKMAGFNDIKHFYKVFKKSTGLAPNEYRNL